VIPLLLGLVLAAPGIRVRVDGAATEVVAWRDRAEAGRAPVRDGVAALSLPEGAYSLWARGPEAASDVVHGVRSVDGSEDEGFDVRLEARPGHRLTVKTEPGARLFWQDVPLPLETVLPAGLHAVVVDHPQRVSSARRLVRLAGPTGVSIPLERGLLVTGRVWRKASPSPASGPERVPLSGARVEAFADGLAQDRVAVTDATGRFGLTGFRGRVVSLAVRAPGLAARLVRVEFYPGEERARVEVELDPGSAVRVAADTEARFLRLPAWLDAALEDRRVRPNMAPPEQRGRTATFRSLRPGERYRVLAVAPGRRPVRSDTFVAPPGGETLSLATLQLPRGASVSGRVTGAPAGSVVVCRGDSGEQRCRTDRRGRYRFLGLDAGRYVLEVADHDERPREIRLEADEEAERDLAAHAGDGEISGTVFSADGEPLEGVLVSTAGRTARTDAEGRFRLGPLPRGRRRFTVRARPGPDCRALAGEPHLPLVEPKARAGPGLRLRLARAGVLRLALSTDGRPLARARVRLAGVTGLRIVRVARRGARTLVVPDVPVGTYTVDVTAPGLFGVRETVAHARPAGVAAEPDEVAVWEGRSAAGRVVLRRVAARPGDAPHVLDRPAPRGRVVLLDPRPERVFAFAPVEGGAFLLEGLPPRPVVLAVDCPGRPVAWRAVDLSAGDVEGLELVVDEGTELAVRVLGLEPYRTEIDGRIVTQLRDVPLPDARVHFETEHGLDVRDLNAWVRFRGCLAADGEATLWDRLAVRSEGERFWLPDVHPGSYRAVVRAEGYKQLRVGVRARSALARGQAADVPELPRDWAPPIRLSQESGPERGRNEAEKNESGAAGRD